MSKLHLNQTINHLFMEGKKQGLKNQKPQKYLLIIHKQLMMLIKIFIYRFYITILSRKYLTKEAPNHSSNIILTGKDVLPEKDLLEKAKTIK